VKEFKTNLVFKRIQFVHRIASWSLLAVANCQTEKIQEMIKPVYSADETQQKKKLIETRKIYLFYKNWSSIINYIIYSSKSQKRTFFSRTSANIFSSSSSFFISIFIYIFFSFFLFWHLILASLSHDATSIFFRLHFNWNFFSSFNNKGQNQFCCCFRIWVFNVSQYGLNVALNILS